MQAINYPLLQNLNRPAYSPAVLFAMGTSSYVINTITSYQCENYSRMYEHELKCSEKWKAACWTVGASMQFTCATSFVTSLTTPYFLMKSVYYAAKQSDFFQNKNNVPNQKTENGDFLTEKLFKDVNPEKTFNEFSGNSFNKDSQVTLNFKQADMNTPSTEKDHLAEIKKMFSPYLNTPMHEPSPQETVETKSK